MAKPNVKSLIKNLKTTLQQDTPPEKCYEFKTEKKNEVNKKLKSIKKHIISQGYHDVQQG